MEIIEMSTFDFFFLKRCSFLPASSAVPIILPVGRREGIPLTIIISERYTYKPITIYCVETLLFVCCRNMIFHIKTAVFQVLWTIFLIS